MKKDDDKKEGYIAYAYFYSAMLISKQIDSWLSDEPLDCDDVSPHHLLYPMVFSFKNGMELILKKMQKNLWGCYDNNTHNFLTLINRLTKYNFDSKNRKSILGALESIKNIFMPYYTGTYLGANGQEPDINNEAERFPEAKHENVYCPNDTLTFQVNDNKKIEEINSKFQEDMKQIKENLMYLLILTQSCDSTK